MRSARWRTMGAGGDVLAARGDTRSRPRARRLWKGEAMMQDGLDIKVPQPALMFDLDGALVDSVYQHVIAWQEALATCGIELSVWRIQRRIGMSGGVFLDARRRATGGRLEHTTCRGPPRRRGVRVAAGTPRAGLPAPARDRGPTARRPRAPRPSARASGAV